MVLEERTYTIKPGQIPAFLAIYEREGCATSNGTVRSRQTTSMALCWTKVRKHGLDDRVHLIVHTHVKASEQRRAADRL